MPEIKNLDSKILRYHPYPVSLFEYGNPTWLFNIQDGTIWHKEAVHTEFPESDGPRFIPSFKRKTHIFFWIMPGWVPVYNERTNAYKGAEFDGQYKSIRELQDEDFQRKLKAWWI